MGCLLGCFGRRKNRRRQRRRESLKPRLNRISEGSTKDVDLNLKVPPKSVYGDHLKLSVPFGKEVPKFINGDHLNLRVPSVEEVVPKSVNGDHLNLKVPSVEEVVPKFGNGDHLNLMVPSVEEVVPKFGNGDNLKLSVPSVEEVPKISVISITEICDKAEEKKSTSPSPSPSPSRKRVTFDSNVKTYEHIAVQESIDLFEEEKEEVKSLKSRQSQCSSKGSDITTNSSGSYPSNHRYQNCRESDDEEDDVTDCDDSDLEDDDEEDGLLDEDYYDEDIYEDKLNKWDKEVYTEEIADNGLDIERTEERTNVSARDRSGYVNAVLNPIENLTQWKAVKSKGRTTTQTQSRKENMTKAPFSLEEPRVDKISSASSSSSSLFSLNLKSRDETKNPRTQDIAVDASLSTWLSTSTTSSVSMGGETAMSEQKEYSKAVHSHDKRPILGAVTAEDIKQFSVTNSPRKSPSRSPESHIIGTVGRYWNNHSMVTSKYRDV